VKSASNIAQIRRKTHSSSFVASATQADGIGCPIANIGCSNKILQIRSTSAYNFISGCGVASEFASLRSPLRARARRQGVAMSVAETVPSPHDDNLATNLGDAPPGLPVGLVLLLATGGLTTLLWIGVVGWGLLALLGLI
jgi:hypothetical protein